MSSSSKSIVVNEEFINNIIKEMNNTIEKLTFENSEKDKIILQQSETISRLKNPDKLFYKIGKKQMLYNIQYGNCCYCGKNKSIDEMTVEHLIPKSCGGTRKIGNLSLSCKKCNNKRGNNLYNTKTLDIIQSRASIAWWSNYN